jgi:hypothetical protein
MSHATDVPSCPKGGIAAMQKITVDNRNFYVAPAVAPVFAGFLAEIVAKGYSLDEGILDDWSYACRPVRGSASPSEHSRGTAVDINAVHNPMGSTLRTDMPWWVPVVAKKWGLRWGGTYSGRKDAMHFEFMGTKEDAAHILASVKVTEPRDQPDTDGITPSDSPEAIKFLQVLLNLNGQHIPVDGIYGKATGQAIRNLKWWYTKHGVVKPGDLDRSARNGWKAEPRFLAALAAWTSFLKAHGAF